MHRDIENPSASHIETGDKEPKAVHIREATLEDSSEVSPMLIRLGLRFPVDPAEARR